MLVQPTGTVTLLFTDVEGSTLLLERLGVERFAEVLALHRRVLREAFARHGGYEVDEEGDAFLVAFPAAAEAVAAAREAQQGLSLVEWPHEGGLRVRMGVHTGEPLPVPPKYVGMDVHRAARIMAAGHGGQVLVSETTAALLDGTPLLDLGPHRLKDMLQPIRLYQLEGDGLPDEFPPLRSLQQSNLPVAAWPLLGRERELEEIRDLIEGNVRLVTLTGAGGSGKTRLALQAAAELSDQFPDGVFFVGLAPLRETSTVFGAVAEAVGLQADDDVVAWLAARRALLVLDNLEHLADLDVVVAELLVGETTILATSRTPLRLAVERELPVEPLLADAAVELFVSRAGAAGRRVEADETVAAICRRLDNLPLALELAAARSKLLSPVTLLQRLDAALPLLTGGAGDRPERQRTLRATIEWSHDLLNQEAQMAFRRLSVFRGSFTLDAAEAVAAADLDQVAALLDQSLLKPLGEERFFLLETLREYAREQLDEAGETAQFDLRHAHHYLTQLTEQRPLIFGPQRGLLLAWFGQEEDNLRAALDRLEESSSVDAAQMANLLGMYWLPRGQLGEARERIGRLLAAEGVPTGIRAALLSIVAECEERSGDYSAALEAATEALALAEEASDPETISGALYIISWVALARGDLRQATEVLTRALEDGSDDGWSRALVLAGLAAVHTEAGRDDQARDAFHAARVAFRAAGDEANDIACAIQLAELELYAGDLEAAAAAVEPALLWTRSTGDTYRRGGALGVFGFVELGRGRPAQAMGAFSEALELVLASERTGSDIFMSLLTGIAFASRAGWASLGVRLLGAADKLNDARGYAASPRERELERAHRQRLIETAGDDHAVDEQLLGAAMSLEETIALATSLAHTSDQEEAP